MLNKQETPTFDDLIRYSGESGSLWLRLDANLQQLGATREIRFPYGKDYGWSAKYSVKKKHICDIFAENGAFTALFQVSAKAIETVYDELDDYAKQVWADNSPCSTGGWISFQVQTESQMENLEKIILAKIAIR